MRSERRSGLNQVDQSCEPLTRIAVNEILAIKLPTLER